MSKLIRSLKWAHAAEISAYYAYVGHAASVTNRVEKQMILKIAQDELEHISDIKKWLNHFNHKPSSILNLAGLIVGKTVGTLCHCTGWYWPMKIAGVMEAIGTNSYIEMSLLTENQQLKKELQTMAIMEAQHEDFFDEITNRNVGSKAENLFFKIIHA